MVLITAVRDFEENTSNLLTAWKESNNNINKTAKTIKENEICISTLEANNQSTLSDKAKEYFTIIKDEIIKSNKESQRIIDNHNSLAEQVEANKQTCFEVIKKILQVYDLIEVSQNTTSPQPFSEEEQDQVQPEEIIKSRKLVYSNICDNLQLREDPPIHGVYKNGFKKRLEIPPKEDTTIPPPPSSPIVIPTKITATTSIPIPKTTA